MNFGIGNVKGGGGKQLYQHNIYLHPKTANGSFAILTIINDNNTPIDFTALANYVKNGTNNTRYAYGRADNDASHLVYKLGYYEVNNTDYLRYHYLTTSGTGGSTNPQDSSAWLIEDDWEAL